MRNFSAEGPDVPSFFGFFQCGDLGTNPPFSTCASIISQEQSDFCAAACYPDSVFVNELTSCSAPCGSTVTIPAGMFIGVSTAGATALAHAYACAGVSGVCSFSNQAQSCTIQCADLSFQTYTVAAGLFSGSSQAQVNGIAASLACELAALQCFGSLVPSTPQTCSLACPATGATVTMVVPAGAVFGLSQESADAQAQEIACLLALLSCDALPPLIGNAAQSCSQICQNVQVFQAVPAGAFVAATVEEANQIAAAWCVLTLAAACAEERAPDVMNVGNGFVSCSIACAGGGTFTNFVSPNSFRLENRSAADAAALSYCQSHLIAGQFCLGDIDATACVNSVYASAISGTGSTATGVTSGSLPPGLSLSGGILAGIPTTPGIYTFTISAINAANNRADRTYTIQVGEITPAILPDGTLGTPYAQALTAAGFTNPVFTVAGGSLPTGLSIGPATGVISGTPTAAGDFSFVIEATEGALVCSQPYDVTIVSSLSPQVWYAMETTGATIADVSGNGADMALAVGTAATAAAGKVALAATKATNSCRYNTGDSAFLAWPGSGDVNVFGWVKITSPGTSIATTQRIGITLDSVGFTGIGELTVRGNNTWRFDNNNGLVLSGALAVGTFHFYRVHYDSAAQKWGVAFDNAAPTYEAGTDVITPSATGQFDLLLNGSFLDVGNTQQADEVCAFFGAMTQADIDGLWASGNGRTFP